MRPLSLICAALIALAGCTTTDSPEPSEPAAEYTYAAFDLCQEAFVAPLAQLDLSQHSCDRRELAFGSGELRRFELRTPDGQRAFLTIEAVVHASAADAQQDLADKRELTSAESDGPITGIGDEAEGFVLADAGEYTVFARDDNLYLKVSLLLDEGSATPKLVLRSTVEAVARAVLDQVGIAWKA